MSMWNPWRGCRKCSDGCQGSQYELIAIANHSETLEKMVVYKALYGEDEYWVRPLSMWEELVEVNGEQVPRFRYIGE